MTQEFPPTPTKLETAGGGSVEGTTVGEPYYPPNPNPGAGTSAGSRPPQQGGPGFSRQQFMKSYANMVAQTWIDPNYEQLLLSDQVDAWVEGARTGLYDLWLPLKPDDVDVSVGGGDPSACVGGASCCCTPCCCCT